MKLQRSILALVALAFVLAPQSPGTALAQSDKRRYSATLMSPRPGQILQPGKVVRIAWMANFPDVDLSMCETEVLLSLDGGKTIYMMLTEQRNPRIQYFDWTVPNMPTNAAVMEVRFGCEQFYPETYAPQPGSTFVIAKAN